MASILIRIDDATLMHTSNNRIRARCRRLVERRGMEGVRVRGMKQYEIWWAELPKAAGRWPVLLLIRDDAYTFPAGT